MNLILDTDIGDDIDDIWALITLTQMPEIKIKLITISTGDIIYKAKVTAYILNKLKKDNIPIALGNAFKPTNTPHDKLIKDVNLNEYKGGIFYDVVSKIDEIIKTNIDVCILSIGPVTNIYKYLLEKENYNNKIIIMGGAYKKGYINQEKATGEYNLSLDSDGFNYIIKHCSNVTIAPLDVCRDFKIGGEAYNQLKMSDKIHCKLIMELYQDWQENYNVIGGSIKSDNTKESTILYDIIPVLFLADKNLFEIKKVKVISNENGLLVESDEGYYLDIMINNKDKKTSINKVLSFLK